MLRGKIFERNEEIRFGGQICPPPVCLGLIRRALKIEIYHIIYFQDSDKETYGAIYELRLKIKSWNTAMSRFQL